jgi:hypothetical protein
MRVSRPAALIGTTSRGLNSGVPTPLAPKGAARSSQSYLLCLGFSRSPRHLGCCAGHNATPVARCSPVGGFTLLEVLISSAILVVILILLIGMADHTASLWHRGEQNRDASREVRAGLELITEDLHSAVITTNPDTLILMNENSMPGGSRLFFLVSHPGEKLDTGNVGDLCATGYFIAADPKSKGASNLYRFHATDPVVTRAIQENRLQALYQSANPTNAATTELLARRVMKLNVQRLEGNVTSGGLLLISLSIPRDERSGNNAVPLREDQLLRYTTLLRLPPQRGFATTNTP